MKVLPGRSNRLDVVVRLSIFLSGFSALLYQVVWQRLLLRLVGATLPALTLILCIFMGGLALGAWLVGKHSQRITQPLLCYAVIELLLALYAVFLSTVSSASNFTAVIQLVSGHSSLSQSISNAYSIVSGMSALHFVLAGLALLLLIIPTTLMGATLPLTAEAIAITSGGIEEGAQARRELSFCYCLNLVGAALGAALAGFVIMPRLGIGGSNACAVAINVLVAFLLFRAAKQDGSAKAKSETGDETPVVDEGKTDVSAKDDIGGEGNLIAALVFICGLLAMMLEVAWTRLFCLVFGSSTYSLSAVLSIYLTALAIGSFVVSRRRKKIDHPVLVISFINMVLALLLSIGFFQIQSLPWSLIACLDWLSGFRLDALSQFIMARLLVTATVILLPCLFMGLVFPIALRACAARVSHAEKLRNWTGTLLCVNTIGSICGACLTGFYLIPRAPLRLESSSFASGIESTLVIVVATQLFLALLGLVIVSSSERKSRRSPRLTACAFLLITGSFIMLQKKPVWDAAVMSSGIASMPPPALEQHGHDLPWQEWRGMIEKDPLLFYKEGDNTTVSVTQNRADNLVTLKNDGKVEATMPKDEEKPSPGSDVVTQTMLGLLPVLLSKSDHNSLFVIGYGSGTTSDAAISSHLVTKVDVAEPEQAVVAARRCFARGAALPETGLKIALADGRNMLAAARSPYMIIVSQPPDPWVNGAADLFTLEFFDLVRSRLVDGGVFCQWLPLYSVDSQTLVHLLRTFHQIFPQSFVFHPSGAGEVLLLGFNRNEEVSFDWTRIARHLEEPDTHAALARLGLESCADIGDMLLLGPEGIARICDLEGDGQGKVNRDANPQTEYRLPQLLPDAEARMAKNLDALQSADVFKEAEKYCGTIAPDRCVDSCRSAERSMSRKNYEQAIMQFSQAVDANQLSARAHVGLAKAYFLAGDRDKALSESARAAQIYPNSFDAHYLRGLLLYHSGAHADGLSEVVLSSRLRADDPAPYYFVAAEHALNSRWQLALQNLEILKTKAPDVPRLQLLSYAIYSALKDDRLAARAERAYEAQCHHALDAEAVRTGLSDMLTAMPGPF